MSYFLGVFPNESEKGQMAQLTPKYASIFDSQDIPVYYPEASKYHLTLLYLGDRLNAFSRFKIGRALKNFKRIPFNAQINGARLGFGYNRNPGLLHLTVTDKGNEFRNMVSELSALLNVRREKIFLPHITIGRVRKELTQMEYLNLSEAVKLQNINVFGEGELDFTPLNISLVKSEDGNYMTIKSFQIS